MRRILHIDLDAFFAAASYEARKYGIHSAMPMKTAMKRCRELQVVKPRFDAYKDASQKVREIFERYTDLIEPLSIDEAYLDVTDAVDEGTTATDIAEAIRSGVRNELKLTASAGVSFNKFLAKIPSDFNKPDGITVVRPDNAAAFLAALPIEKFRGVGKKTAPRLLKMGISTGADLLSWEKDALEDRFGKFGRALYRMARGQDDRPVRTHRERKSVGAERTFFEHLQSLKEMETALEPLAERVARYLRKHDLHGRTVTLKIKSSSFVTKTRRTTLPETIQSESDLLETAKGLLQQHAPTYPVRLLGITASNWEDPKCVRKPQLTLGLANT